MLNELEQELGFSLRPNFRYGNFSLLVAAPIRTPEELLRFVDTFYTSTLLYYRTFPILHFYSSIVHAENKKLNLGGADIERYERLVKLESNFATVVETLEPTLDTTYLVEWNTNSEEAYTQLTKLQWKTYQRKKKRYKQRVEYSTKISGIFRDELIARMKVYKRLREELATSLNIKIHDFLQLHDYFLKYFGTMGFVDLYSFDKGLREGNEGLLWYPDAEGYLEHLVDQCGYAESRMNDGSYLQEYFFTVREYYKEVIKKALEMVYIERYDIEDKKALLGYLLYSPGLFYDLEDMERIWHPYSEGTTGTWKYGDFMQGVHDLDREDIEDMQRFLVKLYAFITENPEFSHSYPKDPAIQMLMESILERKPINPDDLLKKIDGEKKKKS